MTNQVKIDGFWIDLDEGVNPEIGQEYRIPAGKGWQGGGYYNPIGLDEAKSIAIAKVNPEARRRIEALDWMLDRANRHTKLNKSQKKSELEVLQLQQDIEDASDAAIIAIDELTAIEEVNAFAW